MQQPTLLYSWKRGGGSCSRPNDARPRTFAQFRPIPDCFHSSGHAQRNPDRSGGRLFRYKHGPRWVQCAESDLAFSKRVVSPPDIDPTRRMKKQKADIFAQVGGEGQGTESIRSSRLSVARASALLGRHVRAGRKQAAGCVFFRSALQWMQHSPRSYPRAAPQPHAMTHAWGCNLVLTTPTQGPTTCLGPSCNLAPVSIQTASPPIGRGPESRQTVPKT
mmetsp:Transcript_99467/g.171231  ORF Transcript_99467/g.171231 Transcript_99467/m.171231 type:complete len:219 (+) Transcript_99467:3-659(+)